MCSGRLLYNGEREDSTRKSLTEGPCKAGAVNRGLTGMSKRPTIESSLYTQEDGISILMRYKLENRQKKNGRHQSRTERSQRLNHSYTIEQGLVVRG